jgi:hypothetical protein
MSCKWVEFVAHLYIGRWIVFINDVTSRNIVMTSSLCDAEAAKLSIQVFRSISADAVGYVAWYIMANVRIVADRRKGYK